MGSRVETLSSSYDSYALLTLSVCVVDANYERNQRLVNALHTYGHTVQGFARAEDALKAMTTTMYDVVIMGHLGTAKPLFLQAIRKSKYDYISGMPIVALSPNRQIQAHRQLIRSGVNLVVPYSTHINQLHHTLVEMFYTDAANDVFMDVPNEDNHSALRICLLGQPSKSDSDWMMGNEVDCFSNYMDALKVLLAKKVDILVINEPYSDPASHGVQLVRTIKHCESTISYELPILVLTTDSAMNYVRELYLLDSMSIYTHSMGYHVKDYMRTVIDAQGVTLERLMS